MSEPADDSAPFIAAEDLWVKFLIRYHRAEVTIRETLVRWFEHQRERKANGRLRQEFWALQGVSLKAGPGDVIGVIGKNGSGKTTLLKALGGICTPDHGRVEINGTVGCLLSFGVGFNAQLSGRENIYLNGSILGLSQKFIDERIGEIIEFSELNHFIDAPVKTYSAGMKGRLSFSIAAYLNPDILLLDEALSTGDAGFRAKAGSILDRFRSGNKIVVIASHSMELIRKVCTKAVWLESGSIRMQGTPHEVVKAYVEYCRRAGKKGQEKASPASSSENTSSHQQSQS